MVAGGSMVQECMAGTPLLAFERQDTDSEQEGIRAVKLTTHPETHFLH